MELKIKDPELTILCRSLKLRTSLNLRIRSLKFKFFSLQEPKCGGTPKWATGLIETHIL